VASVIADQGFERELWILLEGEDDPHKRKMLLAYFTTHPTLALRSVDRFRSLAESERDAGVRAASVRALAPFGGQAEITALLLRTAETDVDEDCRAAALYGLAELSSEASRSILASAFRSPSEKIRQAALESGASPPTELVLDGLPSYLRREFREARTGLYKSTLINQLVTTSPTATVEVLEEALQTETDPLSIRFYRAVIDQIEAGMVELWQVRRQTLKLYNRFRYRED
jgi:HEAT repeat protein